MIGRPVALNSQQVASRFHRVDDRQVDDESRGSHLTMNLMAEPLERDLHLPLEVGIVVAVARSLSFEDARGGKAQKRLECGGTSRLRALQVDVVGGDRTEDLAALAG